MLVTFVEAMGYAFGHPQVTNDDVKNETNNAEKHVHRKTTSISHKDFVSEHPRGVSSTLFTSLSAHSVHCVRKSLSLHLPMTSSCVFFIHLTVYHMFFTKTSLDSFYEHLHLVQVRFPFRLAKSIVFSRIRCFFPNKNLHLPK